MIEDIKELVIDKITETVMDEIYTNAWMIDTIGNHTGEGYKLSGEFKELYKHICGELGAIAFIDFEIFKNSPHSRKDTVVYNLIEVIIKSDTYLKWVMYNK